ncbi:2-hydroxy-acid oxidase [Phytohabitans rumicis]|uniref:Uncharacterized protein n=1 Tax=Phytohabitans rumicis TaxID=1076125 RepID=A0A6V8L044_9ACTN|nr:2-hydroxy-acid oxidase [Phytohabitans rumicis]GFJ87959.1 hypothetical protein Prum_016010 [Phytohabitans rumicis]
MYTAGPPATDYPGPHLVRAARRAFPGPAARAAHPEHAPHLTAYLSDLVRPYGLALRQPAGGHSYGEMAAALVADTVPPHEPVDLLVLAFAVPDIRPGRATATYLSHICPGAPMAFAVCDQGAAAGFTGLRLIREYARTGGCRRALLLVVEQAGLPYDPAAPVALPTRHTGVALLCGDSGTAWLGPVRQVPMAPGQAGTAPPALPADLDADTLILGNGLGPVPGARSAPSGQPYTGVWWTLAGELADPTARRIVLADHDPVLGYLCTSTVEIGGTVEEGGTGVRVELGAS